jgi:hypothetical protein
VPLGPLVQHALLGTCPRWSVQVEASVWPLVRSLSSLPYSRSFAEELVLSEQETEQYGMEGSLEEAEKPELLFEDQEM